MHGNVWEWCADQWHESYADKSENLKQDGSVTWSDSNMTDSRAILRGGSRIASARVCRSANRRGLDAGNRNNFYGFRVAVSSP
jgi:formylglycine-generating enzyme required for sulfatase activity